MAKKKIFKVNTFEDARRLASVWKVGCYMEMEPEEADEEVRKIESMGNLRLFFHMRKVAEHLNENFGDKLNLTMSKTLV